MQPDAIVPELMYDQDLLQAFPADQGMETIDLSQVTFTPELIQAVPVAVAVRSSSGFKDRNHGVLTP